jgi:hypothetical protein
MEREKIRKTVRERYAGIAGGGNLKKEYLKSITAAGFRDVGIVEDSSFPVSCFSVDPVMKGFIEDLSVSPGAIEALEGSVSNVKECGVKPAAGG